LTGLLSILACELWKTIYDRKYLNRYGSVLALYSLTLKSLVSQKTMQRLIVIAFFMAVYLTISGGYETWILFGTSGKPTAISVAELEDHTPSNRYLNVTDGRMMREKAVVYSETNRKTFTKVPDSEITFIPILPATSGSSSPRLIVRIPEAKMKTIKEDHSFDENSIIGIRKTQWDLEDKVKEFLTKEFGKDAAENMIVLEYGAKSSDDFVTALAKLIGGLVILGVIFRPNPQMIREGFKFS